MQETQFIMHYTFSQWTCDTLQGETSLKTTYVYAVKKTGKYITVTSRVNCHSHPFISPLILMSLVDTVSGLAESPFHPAVKSEIKSNEMYCHLSISSLQFHYFKQMQWFTIKCKIHVNVNTLKNYNNSIVTCTRNN